MPTDPPARHDVPSTHWKIEQVLRSEGQPLLIQDGQGIERPQLLARAERIQAQLAEHGPCRVALTAGGVDAIIVALASCQALGLELLLVRGDYPPQDPVWEALGVSILLDESLSITRSLSSRPDRIGEAGVLLMTSGTTGAPKVALHTLSSLLSRIRHVPAGRGSERWLLTYQPASFAGLQVLLTTLATESQLVAVREPSIAALADAASAHHPTHVSGTPTFWRSFLLAFRDRTRTLPLRQITLGGEACDQALLDDLGSAFPHARITHIYASTEAGALFAVNDKRAGFPASWLTRGIEGVQLRIRDDLLEVKSARSMKTYVGRNVPTVVTDDDWIITGDIVETVDDRVHFRGRVDEIINVGGAKANPETVETVLLRMEMIEEARVFGIRNPVSGAVVGAEIVLAVDTPEAEARRAIHSFASEHLAYHEIPRILRFVPTIATTSSGKKQRKE